MRAVLDTNVFVSAVLRGGVETDALLLAWRAGRLQIITSEPLLRELHGVLLRPRIMRLHARSAAEVEEFVRDLEAAAVVVVPTMTLDVVPDDPDDNRVVEAAVAGRADYIVSKDNDLLRLASHAGIGIVTPTAFLARLAVP